MIFWIWTAKELIWLSDGEMVGGTSGFVKTGYLVIVEGVDRPGIEKNVAMQQELGISTAVVDAAQARLVETARRLATRETMTA